MISFPINEYCTYRKDAPAPEWMTSERMNYCEQPEIGERDILDCISEFLVSLFCASKHYLYKDHIYHSSRQDTD